MKIYLSKWAGAFALLLSIIVLTAAVWMSVSDGVEVGIWFIFIGIYGVGMAVYQLISKKPVVEILDDHIILPVKGQQVLLYWKEMAKVELKEGKSLSIPSQYMEIQFRDNRTPLNVGLPDTAIALPDIIDIMNEKIRSQI